MRAIAVLAGMLLLAGCTDPHNATRLLRAQGFTDIQITGYAWFACSDDDFVQTGFRARTVTGESVSGAVCSGLFVKNSTIRFQ